MTQAKYVGLEAWFGIKQVFHNGDKTNPNVSMVGETVEGFPTNNWTIKEGRAFTNQEVEDGDFVCVLGNGVVEKLFERGSPIGEEIKVDGNKFKVIGTIETKGSFLGGNQDNYFAIPITTAMSLYGRQVRSISWFRPATRKAITTSLSFRRRSSERSVMSRQGRTMTLPFFPTTRSLSSSTISHLW